MREQTGQLGFIQKSMTTFRCKQCESLLSPTFLKMGYLSQRIYICLCEVEVDGFALINAVVLDGFGLPVCIDFHTVFSLNICIANVLSGGGVVFPTCMQLHNILAVAERHRSCSGRVTCWPPRHLSSLVHRRGAASHERHVVAATDDLWRHRGDASHRQMVPLPVWPRRDLTDGTASRASRTGLHSRPEPQRRHTECSSFLWVLDQLTHTHARLDAYALEWGSWVLLRVGWCGVCGAYTL